MEKTTEQVSTTLSIQSTTKNPREEKQKVT